MNKERENNQINFMKDSKRPEITLELVPPGKIINFPRYKTVRQLLHALDLMEETALVARDGKLLTPDRHIWPNDHILVRVVASRG